MNQFQLLPTNTNNIPFNVYEKDFTFIINEVEFKTNKIIADMLSPIISKIHLSDPLFDEFVINTQEYGDFSHILQLIDFKKHDIPEKELPYYFEVIEKLGNSEINFPDGINSTEITNDNVFSLIKTHEKLGRYYSKSFDQEIEYICAHFFELCETEIDEFMNINVNTVNRIINNENLCLKSEDQLLNFVNELYSKNPLYSNLYEAVYFLNVSSESMNDFLYIFDKDDLSGEIWNKLGERLGGKIDPFYKEMDIENKRYNTNIKNFPFTEDKIFQGILNHLKMKSYGNIESNVKITGSSFYSNINENRPYNVTLYNNDDKFFFSADEENSWICFEFLTCRIIPKYYSIKTLGKYYPKSWVIEVSNDNVSWSIVDSQNDCQFLNGRHYVHTFNICNPQSNSYKYLRMRQTGETWSEHYHLLINSFEIYGYLV